MSQKEKAGWLSLFVGLGLALESAIARLLPNSTTSSSEAPIIASIFAFSAAVFSASAYESRGKKKG